MPATEAVAPKAKADPFALTVDEKDAVSCIGAAARAGMLAIVTGTFRHQRRTFVGVIEKKGDGGDFFPLAVLLAPEDLDHCRDNTLSPLGGPQTIHIPGG